MHTRFEEMIALMSIAFSRLKRFVFIALLVFPFVTAYAASNYLPQALLMGKKVERWNDATDVIYVHIWPGNNLSHWKPSDINLVKSAFSEWQNALDHKITFAYTTDPELTDINVKWNAHGTGFRVGEQKTALSNGTFSDIDIEIDLFDRSGRPLPDSNIKWIALHEIGHALGIKGHSLSRSDIMYADVQLKSPKLSLRDINTIRELYNRKPDITNPLGIHLMQYRTYIYYMHLGTDAFNHQHYDLSYEDFVKAQKTYDKDPHLCFYLGVSALRVKQYDVAVSNLKTALARKKDDPFQIQYDLATALLSEGRDQMLAGQKEPGLQKLILARSYYNNLLQNPKTPSSMRQLVRTVLTQLNSTLATYGV
jgi:tetratricopeptide (TPR) repeat protein